MKTKHIIFGILLAAAVSACQGAYSVKDTVVSTKGVSYTVDVNGGVVEIPFYCNMYWHAVVSPANAVSDVSDVLVFPICGVGSEKMTTLKVTVPKNYGNKRDILVNIIGEAGESAVRITQKGAADPTVVYGSIEMPYPPTMLAQQMLSGDVPADAVYVRGIVSKVKEISTQYGNATFWLTEEARDFVGITESSPDLSLLWGRYPNPTVTAVGGVIENFRRYPVNGVDQLRQYNGFTKELLCAVMINKSEILPYIWIQTDVDHAAFDRWFKEVAANSYRQSSGIADLLSRKNVLCGYFEDIIARDHKDLQRFVRVVELFGLITILISMLGLMAISTWFASSNAKGIAIRKVFGGTMDSELWRTVRSYMVMTGIATIIGLPVAVVLIRRFLEDYPERIDSYTSILSVTVLLTLIIAFSSVIWQTLKAAKTNPAIELKKE